MERNLIKIEEAKVYKKTSEKLKIFGIPDEFPIVGTQEDQRDAAGLTKDKILESLSSELSLKDLEKKVSAQ